MKTTRLRAEPIDWTQIHARLARIQTAAEEGLRFSPERTRLLLEERARVLSRMPPTAIEAAHGTEIVTFSLANEQYAIETRYVREVIRLTDYTPVPGSPPFLVGVLNLRGDILGVMDLRTFFGVAGKGLSDLSRVLVLGQERLEFGVLADAAHEVRTLRLKELFEPPGSVAGIGREYLLGVTNEALIVLNGAALLQDSRLFIDQEEGTKQ